MESVDGNMQSYSHASVNASTNQRRAVGETCDLLCAIRKAVARWSREVYLRQCARGGEQLPLGAPADFRPNLHVYGGSRRRGANAHSAFTCDSWKTAVGASGRQSAETTNCSAGVRRATVSDLWEAWFGNAANQSAEAEEARAARLRELRFFCSVDQGRKNSQTASRTQRSRRCFSAASGQTQRRAGLCQHFQFKRRREAWTAASRTEGIQTHTLCDYLLLQCRVLSEAVPETLHRREAVAGLVF